MAVPKGKRLIEPVLSSFYLTDMNVNLGMPFSHMELVSDSTCCFGENAKGYMDGSTS